MRVAIVGKGNVGKALGSNIAAVGHDVTYGVRAPEDPKYAGDHGIPLKRVGQAVSDAEILILAINWAALDDALAECGDKALHARPSTRSRASSSFICWSACFCAISQKGLSRAGALRSDDDPDRGK